MARAALPEDHFYPATRAQWRRWLERNHHKAPRIWLVYDKGSRGGKDAPATRAVTYDAAVEEALCFGWIDSVMGKVDDRRYRQLFTPRKKGSGWSASNKKRAAALIESGLMRPEGLAKIDAAKADGSWSKLDAMDNLTVPPDLARALRKNVAARRHFEAFSPSGRKGLLWWIASAKKPETRARRIAATVDAAAEGRKAM